jgi:hypothetical protein
MKLATSSKRTILQATSKNLRMLLRFLAARPALPTASLFIAGMGNECGHDAIDT